MGSLKLARSIAALALVSIGVSALGSDRNAVLGTWASHNSIIEIREVGGLLSARVVAIRDAVYKEDESGPQGEPRRDDRNSDPAARDRLIVGIDLLSDYRFDAGQWRGRIYDPESGKTYSSQMKVAKDGTLEMRGYLGVPWIGRTAVFEPVARCTPAIVAMLELATPRRSCG